MSPDFGSNGLVPEWWLLEGVEEFLLVVGDGARECGGGVVDRDRGVAQGRSWRTRLRIASPVRFWASRATARAVNAMVRCAWIESRLWWNMGLVCRSVLGIRNDCSTCHRSSVAGDDFGGGHQVGGDVGDVALQTDQSTGSVQRGLVE